jgi:hypothetical protein
MNQTKKTVKQTNSKVEPRLPNLDELEEMQKEIWPIVKGVIDDIDNALSTVERMRKLGSGIRRYGFIDKVSDVATDNMQYAPRIFDVADLKEDLRYIEQLRNMLLIINQFGRALSDMLLIRGDDAFAKALLYYNSVRELARRRVPGAEAVFRILQPFFRTTRKSTQEPTEPEVERDVRSLLRGSKEGKIVIENEKPRVTKGKRIVVDETYQDRGAWKETERG